MFLPGYPWCTSTSCETVGVSDMVADSFGASNRPGSFSCIKLLKFFSYASLLNFGGVGFKIGGSSGSSSSSGSRPNCACVLNFVNSRGMVLLGCVTCLTTCTSLSCFDCFTRVNLSLNPSSVSLKIPEIIVDTKSEEEIRCIFDDNWKISRQGDSNGHPQQRFLWRFDKNYPLITIKLVFWFNMKKKTNKNDKSYYLWRKDNYHWAKLRK